MYSVIFADGVAPPAEDLAQCNTCKRWFFPKVLVKIISQVIMSTVQFCESKLMKWKCRGFISTKIGLWSYGQYVVLKRWICCVDHAVRHAEVAVVTIFSTVIISWKDVNCLDNNVLWATIQIASRALWRVLYREDGRFVKAVSVKANVRCFGLNYLQSALLLHFIYSLHCS